MDVVLTVGLRWAGLSMLFVETMFGWTKIVEERSRHPKARISQLDFTIF